MVANAYNTSTREVKAGGFEVNVNKEFKATLRTGSETLSQK